MIFRGCFDLMDMVKDDHKKEVRAFAQEVLSGWLPFLEQAIRSPLPDRGNSDSQRPRAGMAP